MPISAPVDVAGSRGAVSALQIADMRIHQDLHVRRNLAPDDRPNHEMEVIRHQAKRQQPHGCAFRRKRQSAQKPPKISIFQENRLTLVSPVHNVQGNTVEANTRTSRHEEPQSKPLPYSTETIATASLPVQGAGRPKPPAHRPKVPGTFTGKVPGTW